MKKLRAVTMTIKESLEVVAKAVGFGPDARVEFVKDPVSDYQYVLVSEEEGDVPA